MENNKNNPEKGSGQIDDLFRRHLEGQRVEPGVNLWRGINRKLLLNEMIHFNFSNLPGMYWIAGISGIIIIPLILFMTLSPAKNKPSSQKEESKTVQTVPLTGAVNSAVANGNAPVAKAPVVTLHNLNPGTNPSPGTSVNTNISGAIPQPPSNPIKNEKKSVEINSAPAPVSMTQIIPSKKSGPPHKPVQPIAIASTTAANKTNLASKQKKIVTENENANSTSNSSSNETMSPDENANPVQYASNTSIIPMIPLTLFDTLGKKKIKYPAPNLINLGIYPSTGQDHAVIPQFFSLGLEFMPGVTFYKTPSSYSRVDYWFGADLAYHLWKFYVRPGVRIGYVYADGAYQVNYKRNDSIGFYREVVSYSIDPEHPGVIIYNTVNHTVYDSILHNSTDQTHNRYQYIQVPLIFGFDILQWRKFGFSVQAGPVVSFFLADQETSAQNTDLTNARLLSRVQSTPPGKNPNWQIWGAIHVDYKFAEYFDCYLEPTCKYYFSPLVGNETAPVQVPWSMGLGIGIRYNFGYNTQNP